MAARRYLVVDDNVAFAENLAEIVADAGAEAVIVDSGPRALELVGEQRFDALVSDMRMPEMNGAELVHRIRRADPALPALVVTAYTADNELEAARQEGLIGVLPKPVPVARLLELLGGARRNGIVALVEDDVALADNLTEALRTRGFAAVTAGSVIETERLGVRAVRGHRRSAAARRGRRRCHAPAGGEVPRAADGGDHRAQRGAAAGGERGLLRKAVRHGRAARRHRAPPWLTGAAPSCSSTTTRRSSTT